MCCPNGNGLEKLDGATGCWGSLLQKRAQAVTGKTSAIISECRCAVAKERHERAAKESPTEAAAEKRRVLELDVHKYYMPRT
jgi:hypothetical protein